jgi:hypothetical protein
LQQVADYIDTGDTNTRYTRAADTALRTALRSQSGLDDPWVQLHQGGVDPTAGADAVLCDNPALNNECEIVDKILYRGSRILSLAASSFTYDGNNFLNTNPEHEGAILSDHNPILTSFSWSVSPTFRQSAFSQHPPRPPPSLSAVPSVSTPSASSLQMARNSPTAAQAAPPFR